MLRMATFAAAFMAFCSAAFAADVGGTYSVSGTNPDGSKYSGTAEITVTSKNTCRIRWDTGTTSDGICMRNENAFSASYVLGNDIGLVIYEIMDDGSLQGLWTIADHDGVGTETLVPSH